VQFREVSLLPASSAVGLGELPAKSVRMGVWSVTDVRQGDELLVSYGKGFWSARQAE
jgi:hypothetical protein